MGIRLSMKNVSSTYSVWQEGDKKFAESYPVKKVIKDGVLIQPFGEVTKLTNKLNGKIYIEGNKYPMYGKEPKGKKIKEAIEKYGRYNFIWSSLGVCYSKEQLFVAVRTAIFHYNSRSPECGYNLGKGKYIKQINAKEIEMSWGVYPRVIKHNEKFWLIIAKDDVASFAQEFKLKIIEVNNITVWIPKKKEIGKICEKYKDIEVYMKDKYSLIIDVEESEDVYC